MDNRKLTDMMRRLRELAKAMMVRIHNSERVSECCYKCGSSASDGGSVVSYKTSDGFMVSELYSPAGKFKVASVMHQNVPANQFQSIETQHGVKEAIALMREEYLAS